MQKKKCEKFNILKTKMVKRLQPLNMKSFNKKFNLFVHRFKSRWESSHRKERRFLELNKNWLDSTISFETTLTKRGRKEIAFEECNEKVKARKSKYLRDSNSLPILAYATQMALRSSGQIRASQIVKDITSSPTSVDKYNCMSNQTISKEIKVKQALAVLVDGNLSRNAYDIIRKSAPEKIPSYKKVQQAKKKMLS